MSRKLKALGFNRSLEAPNSTVFGCLLSSEVVVKILEEIKGSRKRCTTPTPG